MSRFKPKFKIGDQVLVAAKVIARYDRKENRSIEKVPFEEPVQVIVTGYGFLQEGKKVHGYDEHMILGVIRYSYFAHTHCIRVVKFRRYMIAKEEFALEEDCCEEENRKVVPYGAPMPERDKEAQRQNIRDYPENYPRDSKGRFVSWVNSETATVCD